MVDDSAVANQPDVQTAAAQLRQAYLNHARTGVVAPVSGYVARRSAQVGQRVQPGSVLMAVVPLEQVWVEANFKKPSSSTCAWARKWNCILICTAAA